MYDTCVKNQITSRVTSHTQHTLSHDNKCGNTIGQKVVQHQLCSDSTLITMWNWVIPQEVLHLWNLC